MRERRIGERRSVFVQEPGETAVYTVDAGGGKLGVGGMTADVRAAEVRCRSMQDAPEHFAGCFIPSLPSYSATRA